MVTSDERQHLWPSVWLASPALFVLLGVLLNAVFYESGLWRGAWLEGFITAGVFGGGLLSLLTTPALFFYVIGIGRTTSSSVRAALYVLLGMAVLAMIIVLRYLVGLSDLS